MWQAAESQATNVTSVRTTGLHPTQPAARSAGKEKAMAPKPKVIKANVELLKLYLETVEKIERRRKDLRGLIGKDGNSMDEEQAYTKELSDLTTAQNEIQAAAREVASSLGKA